MSFAFTLEDGILLVGLVGYAAWWAYDLRKGTKLSRLSLGSHITIYALFAVWVWLSGLVALYYDGLTHDRILGLSYVFLVPIPFIAATVGGLRFARRRLVVHPSSTGGWTYRGAAAVPLLWLAIWFIRIGLEDGLLGGYSVFTSPFLAAHTPAGVAPVTFAAVVLSIVDLYFISFGFLIGFTLAVWGRFRRERKELEMPHPAWTGGGAVGTPAATAPAAARWIPRAPTQGPFGVSAARVVEPGYRPASGAGARTSLGGFTQNLPPNAAVGPAMHRPDVSPPASKRPKPP